MKNDKRFDRLLDIESDIRMKDIKYNFISETATIKEAVETIERSKAKIALVVDDEQHLLGSITDGDVRRGILNGIDLNECVTKVMNTSPHVAHIGDDPEHVVDLMRQNICRHIPLVDENNRVMTLETLDELVEYQQHDNWVMILAGGLGRRLSPLTNDCPKPMLPMGGKPILDVIIEGLKNQGFSRFFISVNYLGHIIQDYFGDGSKFGVNIEYILEDYELGTGGPLSLLPEKPTQPMIVMNGDILTKVNFSHLLNFHSEYTSSATICVRDHVVEIPFGVIKHENHTITSIVEKPLHKFMVNAGIYVLNPEAISIVPEGKYYDMPTLFEDMLEANLQTTVFPISEYWLDIGQIDDLNRAKEEFTDGFDMATGKKL